jgi:hypothetical protein
MWDLIFPIQVTLPAGYSINNASGTNPITTINGLSTGNGV